MVLLGDGWEDNSRVSMIAFSNETYSGVSG